MHYKLLGKSGLRVSELALGTMTFGEDWGWGANQATSQGIFDAFVNAGGNFIDTACNYTNGTAEKFVGEFTKTERDYFVIASKYTLHSHFTRPGDLNAGGNHRKNMIRTVEGSLKRLQTDYLDLLFLHIWDGTTPVDEILRAMDDLVRAGKVHYVGISDSPAWVTGYAVATAELRGWPRFVAYQGEYNLLTRGAEREILPLTRALDLAFMAFGLLAGGQLSGKFNAGKPSEHTRVGEPEPRALKMAELVGEIANEIGCSPAQVATNWARQQAPNVIPIIGSRRLPQIEDNLRTLAFPLSPEHLQRLNAALPLPPEYPDDFYKSPGVMRLAYGEAMEKLER
ncbi:MAG: aldo/keto reductase [Anaerolineales bacterium]|nr:aldo/keto reductase [Anaerolineales bacterium]